MTPLQRFVLALVALQLGLCAMPKMGPPPIPCDPPWRVESPMIDGVPR